MSIRLDEQLRLLLAEGARRTPLSRRDLVRRTLRLHLRSVIEQESNTPAGRITSVDPWPPGVLARAYKRVGLADDRAEAAATAAQGAPSWED